MNPIRFSLTSKVIKPWPVLSHNVLVIYWSKMNYPHIQQLKTTSSSKFLWIRSLDRGNLDSLVLGLPQGCSHLTSQRGRIYFLGYSNDCWQDSFTPEPLERHLPRYRASYNTAACFIGLPVRRRAREMSQTERHGVLKPGFYSLGKKSLGAAHTQGQETAGGCHAQKMGVIGASVRVRLPCRHARPCSCLPSALF